MVVFTAVPLYQNLLAWQSQQGSYCVHPLPVAFIHTLSGMERYTQLSKVCYAVVIPSCCAVLCLLLRVSVCQHRPPMLTRASRGYIVAAVATWQPLLV